MLGAIPSRFIDPSIQQQQQQPQQQQQGPQQLPQSIHQQPQQQQQQQQQPQPQPPPNPTPQNPSPLSIPPAPPQPNHTPPADLTLAGVLHFLQSEWRRYERDRNEWEIERAELRARVALLEGERRSFDNVKLDLVRRIKMLEYALKSERSKQLSSAPSIPAHKMSSLRIAEQANDSASSSSDPAPPSAPGSPRSEPDALPNGPVPATTAAPPSQPAHPSPPKDVPKSLPKPPAAKSSSNLAHLGLGAPPPGKDPKSRARSREYLKACLQEVSYLTSTAALNPLPNRALVPPAIPPPLAQAPPIDHALGRPRKSLIGGVAPPAPLMPSAMAAISSPLPSHPMSVLPSVGRGAGSPPRLPELPNGLLGAPPAGRSGEPEVIPLPSSSSASEESKEPVVAPDAPPTDVTSVEGGMLVQEAVIPAPEDVAPTPAPAVASDPVEPAPAQPPTESPGSAASVPPSADAPHDDTPAATAEGEPSSHEGGERLLPPEAQSEHQSSLRDPSPERPGMYRLERGPAAWSHDEEHGQQVPLEGAWGERLRAAQEMVQRATREDHEEQEAEMGILDHEGDDAEDDEDEDEGEAEAEEGVEGDVSEPDLGVGVDAEVDVSAEAGENDAKKVWQARRALRSHLDAVRAISWHPRDCALATASDDCTVKLWRLEASSFTTPSTRLTSEPEPLLTYRGHSAPLTALVHSPLPSQKLLFSASLDATIRIWGVPDKLAHAAPYAPFNPAYTHRATLVGHAEAVWALGVLPAASDAGQVLASAGADGSVKVWGVEGRGELKASWGYDGAAGGDGEGVKKAATSLEPCKTELNRVVVGWADAVVKVYDVESGKEVLRLPSDETYDGTPRTQINRIISHPTMPLLVTAHEDKHIRIFDLSSGKCTHSQIAHLDGVTSLSFDAQGFLLASASHDCSLRLWDPFRGGLTCVQEITSHRAKACEGTLDVQFHPTMQLLASSGADGVVKVYSTM